MWIVSVNDPAMGHALDLIPIQGNVRAMLSDNVDPNETRDYARAQRQIDMWFVHNEADLPMVVDFMTSNFVGRDVSVYHLQSVSVRAPGELRTKSVSKDGILPN